MGEGTRYGFIGAKRGADTGSETMRRFEGKTITRVLHVCSAHVQVYADAAMPVGQLAIGPPSLINARTKQKSISPSYTPVRMQQTDVPSRSTLRLSWLPVVRVGVRQAGQRWRSRTASTQTCCTSACDCLSQYAMRVRTLMGPPEQLNRHASLVRQGMSSVAATPCARMAHQTTTVRTACCH